MTREQLDAIRARVAWLEENGGIGLPFAEARALLDEVERLKAREEALVQQSVAQIGLSGWQYKQIERLKAERNAALEAARPRPSQPAPTNDAQTIYQVGYEDGQKQGMDRMQQAIIDMLSESHPSIVARIVAMEYP